MKEGNVMVPRDDDDSFAVPVDETVRQTDEKLLGLFVLALQFLARLLRARPHPVDDVPADNDQIRGRDSRLFLPVSLPVRFERVEQRPIRDLLLQVTVEIRYV